ncbi:MAG TPA: SpoIID/LytB domain-containing protein, partial [Actinomycetota bacterium]|nr:SpoIID/LytB domain-containing protein [Actinomycetota bacterium]
VAPPEASPTVDRRDETNSSAPARSIDVTTPTETGSDDAAYELSAPLVQIEAPRGGSFHVQATYPWSPSPCVSAERLSLDARYAGALSVRATDDGTMNVTVTISFREYLEGIAEVPPTWPRAALEAQVIAARSYVLSRTGWTGEQGQPLGGPICATSDCQVYGGIPRPSPAGIERWYRAVRATTGLVLISHGRPADTVYSSTSNGRTYGNEDVFGSAPLPYLRPVIERHDGASPLSRWKTELPFGDLETVLRAAGSWPEDAPVSSAAVEGSTIIVRGGGQTRTLDASGLRDAVNTWAPCLLPRRYPSGGLPVTIPSGWFSVSSTPRALVVEGRGWGHGVGMVQWGAYGKALRGWSASRILSFYYGGLTPRSYPEPGSLQVLVATGVRSMTVDPSRRGATIGDRTLGPSVIRISGGDEISVSAR